MTAGSQAHTSSRLLFDKFVLVSYTEGRRGLSKQAEERTGERETHPHCLSA